MLDTYILVVPLNQLREKIIELDAWESMPAVANQMPQISMFDIQPLPATRHLSLLYCMATFTPIRS